jgi:D-aspartate ligase
MNISSKAKPPAVVVGLCAHGLDLTKALARKKIKVYALESNQHLPGTKTIYAEVSLVRDINGPGLVQALKYLAEKIETRQKPVLFLMNDNMVFQISANWGELEDFYQLSWAYCRNTVRQFLLKSSIEKQCEQAGILYPRSQILSSNSNLADIDDRLNFPMVVKPIKPLSGFKIQIMNSVNELKEFIQIHSNEQPFIIQNYIAGDVPKILFCALYLANGKIIAHFEGRKLGSLPTGLGTTTIAAPLRNDILYETACRFFDGLNLSGPVSLEMKMDEKDKLWAIEPTVGRTDYWLGCCVANGVNFPYIEYCQQTGLQEPGQTQKDITVWVDIERDPLCFLSLVFGKMKALRYGKKLAFTYFDIEDIVPFLNLVGIIAVKVFKTTMKRLIKAFNFMFKKQ